MHEQVRIHEVELETQPEESNSDEEGGGLTTEQQVHEALQNLSSASDVQVELRPCDRTEDLLVAQFAMEGCGCRESFQLSSQRCTSEICELSATISVMVSLTWLSSDRSWLQPTSVTWL